jgi:hypothetical protein
MGHNLGDENALLQSLALNAGPGTNLAGCELIADSVIQIN